jgi:hypothetical protein
MVYVLVVIYSTNSIQRQHQILKSVDATNWAVALRSATSMPHLGVQILQPGGTGFQTEAFACPQSLLKVTLHVLNRATTRWPSSNQR